VTDLVRRGGNTLGAILASALAWVSYELLTLVF